MSLLLDTCVVLWLTLESARIPPKLLELLKNPAVQRYMSAASVWEIVVKWQLGKLKLPKPPAEFIVEARQEGRIRPLPVEDAAVLQLQKLPNLHADPFDRMLICQAIEGGMAIVTPDDAIRQYPIKTIWI